MARAVTVQRRGFTLAETMVVVAILGIMVLVAMPSLRQLRDRSNLRAARDELATAVAIARAAAVQKGLQARFRTNGDSVTAATVSNGAVVQVILMQRSLRDLYGARVTVVSGDGQKDKEFTYDARGFATLGATAKYEISVSGYKDTVCVTKLGQIAKLGCQ